MSSDEELDDQEIPDSDEVSDSDDEAKGESILPDYYPEDEREREAPKSDEGSDVDAMLDPDSTPSEVPQSDATLDPDSTPSEVPQPDTMSGQEFQEVADATLAAEKVNELDPTKHTGGMGQVPREQRDDMSLKERSERWADQPEDERGDRPSLTASDEDFALARKADEDAQKEWQDQHPQQNEQAAGGQGDDVNERIAGLLQQILETLQKIEESDGGGPTYL